MRMAINDLAAAVLAGEHDRSIDVVGHLLAVSQAHFSYEEDLMRRRDYPDLNPHAEQHAELLASMERLQGELVARRYVLNRPRTLQFLRDWFSIHLRRTDAGLANFLNQREICFAPAVPG